MNANYLTPFVPLVLTVGLFAQIGDKTDGFLHLPLRAVSGGIRGLAADAGDVLYATTSAAELIAFDLAAGGGSTTLMSGLPLSAPGGLVVGDGRPLSGMDLVLADWNTEMTSTCCDGRVLRIDPNTATTTVLAVGNPTFSSPGDPADVALAPGGAWGNGAYVMDFQGASPNPPVLYRLDAPGNAVTFVVDPAQWTTANAPKDIDFGSAAFGEDLFVADANGPGTIWRVDATANLTPFSTGLAVQALAASHSLLFGDFLYFAAPDGGGTDVFRIDPAGQIERVVDDIGPITTACALAFRPDGKELYVGVGDRIFRVLPATMGLTVNPTAAAANDLVQISVSGGVPNQPMFLLLDGAFGLTLSPPAILLATGLDVGGGFHVPLIVPNGLTGLNPRLQALSIDPLDCLMASNKATLTIL